MPVVAGLTATGAPVVILTSAQASVEIPLEFAQPQLRADYQAIVASYPFVTWAQSFIPRDRQPIKLSKIIIKSVESHPVTNNIEEVRIHVTAARAPQNVDCSSDLILRGLSVAVLVVLRVMLEGAQGENNPRFREHVLFVRQPRTSIGAPETREIPKGRVSNDGKFIGPAADFLEKRCGLVIREDQVEDMTTLAVSTNRGNLRSLGVAVAPAFLDERVRLWLYRETVSRQYLAQLRPADRNSTSAISPDVWSISTAWRVATDVTSLAALFLFHELRYHELMPRYRQPRDSTRATLYSTVAELHPDYVGQSVRVKVAEAYKMVADPLRPGHQCAELIVGDDTGVVRFQVDPALVDRFTNLGQVGSAFHIRNATMHVIEGYAVLQLERYGRILQATGEEAASSHFSFQINREKNMSAIYYEQQPQLLSASQASSVGNIVAPPFGAQRQGRGGGGGGRGQRRQRFPGSDGGGRPLPGGGGRRSLNQNIMTPTPMKPTPANPSSLGGGVIVAGLPTPAYPQ